MKILFTCIMTLTSLSGLPETARAAGVETANVFEKTAASDLGTRVADMGITTRMRVVITLPLADPSGAERFVRSVSTPGSVGYGHYLSPTEFSNDYGASLADYAAVVEWAHANGLITGRPSLARTSLTVTGDAATLGRLFSTRIVSFQTPSGRLGHAPLTMPLLPAALVGKVSGVIGLTDTGRLPALNRLMNPRLAHPDSGSGVLGGFSPSDLRSIYVVPPPFTNATTQSVALFEQGGFDISDIDAYKKRYGLPNTPVIVKGVNGSGTGDTPGIDVECDLDIDMAIAVNRSLKQVIVYEDAGDPFPVALVDSLTDMADDDTAQTISVSYGFDEALAAESDELAFRTVALQLAAQGQTVFVSSGDGGAYGNEPPALNASFPATDPYVTAVGGTTLFNFKGAYAGEEAWNLLGFGAGATGGGISTVFPIPSWQKSAGTSVAVANGGSATMRNVPDVAAVGDPQTGVSVYTASQGGWLVVGGTSVSSPVWAGFASVVNGMRSGGGLPQIGFFNPLLYRLGEANAFGSRDVKDGSNGNVEIYGTPGFNAGPGYDNATGYGSINLGRYVYSVLTKARSTGIKPGEVHGIAAIPTTNGVSVSWMAAAGASGYLVTVAPVDNSVPVSNPLINKTTTKTGLTVGGLASGSAYFLYVYALNSSGAAFAPAVFFSTKSK